MSKKNRAKYERKQAKLMANVEKPVPLHEQSRDLTGPGDERGFMLSGGWS